MVVGTVVVVVVAVVVVTVSVVVVVDFVEVVVSVVVAVVVAVVISQPIKSPSWYPSKASLYASAKTSHSSLLAAATCKWRKLAHVIAGSSGRTGPVNSASMVERAAAVFLQLFRPPKSESTW